MADPGWESNPHKRRVAFPFPFPFPFPFRAPGPKNVSWRIERLHIIECPYVPESDLHEDEACTTK